MNAVWARTCFYYLALETQLDRVGHGQETHGVQFTWRSTLGMLCRSQDHRSHVMSSPPAPRSVYEDLVAKGVIVPAQEVPPPTVPMDYSWARVGALGTPRGGQGRFRGQSIAYLKGITTERERKFKLSIC